MDSDDPADAAARLEAALERIAALARPGAAPSAPPPGPAVDATAVAQRLDALIAELRSVLDRSPA